MTKLMSTISKKPIKDWKGIVAQAQKISRQRMRRVAVAAADDGAVIQAVADAQSFLEDKLADLSDSCYQPEMIYWSK